MSVGEFHPLPIRKRSHRRRGTDIGAQKHKIGMSLPPLMKPDPAVFVQQRVIRGRRVIIVRTAQVPHRQQAVGIVQQQFRSRGRPQPVMYPQGKCQP